MTVETLKQVQGRKVISSDTAESIGTVKGFVLDPAGHRIEAIHVDGSGKRASVLEWSAVAAVGPDAVMASAGAVPTAVEDPHQVAAVKGDVAMIGARVLTVDGSAVGVVDDVEFETESGTVVRVLTDQGAIEPGRLRALGSYALIVGRDADN